MEQIVVHCGMLTVSQLPLIKSRKILSSILYLRPEMSPKACHILTRTKTIPLVRSTIMMQQQWTEQHSDDVISSDKAYPIDTRVFSYLAPLKKLSVVACTYNSSHA